MIDSTKSLVLERASIRTAVAGSIIMLLGVSVFAISAQAETRTVKMNCPSQKTLKVTLKPSEDAYQFEVEGCFCAESAEALKKNIMSFNVNNIGITQGFFEHKINFGETKTATYYCYTDQQIREIKAEDQKR